MFSKFDLKNKLVILIVNIKAMIHEGSSGSINFYLNYKLIQSLPSFESNDLNSIKISANNVILESLRQGNNIKFMKKKFWIAVQNLKEKKLNDEDSTIFAVAFFALIKFNAIEEDADHEGILVMPRKKKNIIKVKKDLIIGNGKSCRTSLCLAAFWPFHGPFKH